MTALPVVANLNKQYFARSETFMYWSLRALRHFEPFCVCWWPIVNRDRFPFPADRCHSIAAPRHSLRRLAAGAWRRLTGHPPLPRRLAPLLRAREARLLHAHYGPVGAWALPLHRMLGLPLVTTFYGYDLAPRIADEPPWWPRRRATLFARGDLFLVEGPHMRDRLIRLGCPPAKVRIQRIALPLALLPSRSPRRRPDAHGPTVLLFAGRFLEKKGLAYALDAVAELIRLGRRVEFRIIGDGPLAPMVRRVIRTRGLDGHVRLLGFLDHAEYLREMAAADLFLHPSVTAADGDTEGGAPTTILEAQALGVPVVSTQHADIPAVVRADESALLVPERDVPALVAALVALLDHPERWAGMGEAGRRHVAAHHDVDREILRLEDLYRQLLARPVDARAHADG